MAPPSPAALAPLPGAPKGCRRCDRLVAYRRQSRQDHPEWYNGAVGPWGDLNARLLILGLAPGLKGANRTGRVFTGDGSGTFLFSHLLQTGWVSGRYKDDGIDSLSPNKVMIANIVACVPPENKPTADEVRNCQPFIKRLVSKLPHVKAILCLGHLAHNACLDTFQIARKSAPFAHGACFTPNKSPLIPAIFDSYHVSRYNTQTGRLTGPMFTEVLDAIRRATQV